MATKTIRSWMTKDAEGNILGIFAGEADASLIGVRDGEGVAVASVEQRTDEVITVPDPKEFERLNELKGLSAIEILSMTIEERDALISEFKSL